MRKCPWIGGDVKKLMNERDQVIRKARKTKSENDWLRYKTLRNQCNNLLKKSGSQYNKNLIEESFGNVSRMFFQPSNMYRVSQNRNRKLCNSPNTFQLLLLY